MEDRPPETRKAIEVSARWSPRWALPYRGRGLLADDPWLLGSWPGSEILGAPTVMEW